MSKKANADTATKIPSGTTVRHVENREKMKQEAAGMWLKIKHITLEETEKKKQVQRRELGRDKVKNKVKA